MIFQASYGIVKL